MTSGGIIGGGTRSFSERLIGALKLDASVYEEVEHDTSAFGQAATVVALAAIAQGLGTIHDSGAGGGLGSLVGSFLGWFIGAGLIWLIGVKVMNCTSDYGELIRTLGFATAPGILGVLGILPLGPLRPILWVAVFVLSTIAAVIAVRQALDVSTGRAVVVCVLANLVPLLLAILFALLLHGTAIPTDPATAGAMGF
jgi:hypothetical protein